MKIRLGFVANSSSSSFCVFGAAIDDSDMIEALLKANIITKEESESDDVYAWELLELPAVQKRMKELNLTYTGDSDNNVTYIGREFTSIGDNETGKQFKDGIKKGIEKFMGKEVEVDTHEGEISC